MRAEVPRNGLERIACHTAPPVTLGKAFDTFAPMGPCLLDANDVALIDLIVSVHFEGR
jgi:2-keto-4-pentenoate hydratase/2-oxohepta-3-ene-1,7-dioic acid hydratase in catechol pathway